MPATQDSLSSNGWCSSHLILRFRHQGSETRIFGNVDDAAVGGILGIKFCDEQTDDDSDQDVQISLAEVWVLRTEVGESWDITYGTTNRRGRA